MEQQQTQENVGQLLGRRGAELGVIRALEWNL